MTCCVSQCVIDATGARYQLVTDIEDPATPVVVVAIDMVTGLAGTPVPPLIPCTYQGDPEAVNDVFPVPLGVVTSIDAAANDTPCKYPEVTTWEIIPGSITGATVTPLLSTDGVFNVDTAVPAFVTPMPLIPAAPDYETVQAGDWLDPATWAGGVIPDIDLNNPETVVIRHDVTLADKWEPRDFSEWYITDGAVLTVEETDNKDDSKAYFDVDTSLIVTTNKFKTSNEAYVYFGWGSVLDVLVDQIEVGGNSVIEVYARCVTADIYKIDGGPSIFGPVFINTPNDFEVKADGSTFNGTMINAAGNALLDADGLAGSIAWIQAVGTVEAKGTGSVDLGAYCTPDFVNADGIFTGALLDDCATLAHVLSTLDCEIGTYSFCYRLLCDGVDIGQWAVVSGTIG